MFSSKKYPLYRAVGHINNAGNPCYVIEIRKRKELPWEKLLFGEDDSKKVKLYYNREEVLKDLKVLSYKAFVDEKEILIEENNHPVILEENEEDKKKTIRKIPKYMKIIK